jgi:hypothetical protein
MTMTPNNHNKKSMVQVLAGSLCVAALLFVATFHNPPSTKLLRFLGSKEDDHGRHLATVAKATACPPLQFPVPDAPTYTAPGMCGRLPADVSPSHLWHAYQDVLWQASRDTVNQGYLADFSSMMNPSMLRKSVRTRPQLPAWGHVLEKLHQRLLVLDSNNKNDSDNKQSVPLQVLILTDKKSMENSCQVPTSLGGTGATGGTSGTSAGAGGSSASAGGGCEWPVKLQQLLNVILGTGVVQVTTLAIPHATSPLATPIAKYHLWPLTPSLSNSKPDVILQAYSSADMYLPNRGVDVSKTTDFYHHQRNMRQALIRAVLEPYACHDDNDDEPPLIILLDEYLGNHHDHLMGELTGLRTLQRLAEWYQLPLVSYAQMVRPLVLSSDPSSSSSMWGPDWSSTTTNNHNPNTQLLAPGHLGVLWALAFNFLDYTVDYCSHQAIRTTTHAAPVPFVEPNVVTLVTKVLLPPMDLDLTLNNISAKWRQAQVQQQQQCDKKKQQQSNRTTTTTMATTTCPMYFYPGSGLSAKALQTIVPSKSKSKYKSGWSLDATATGNQNQLLSSHTDNSQVTLPATLLKQPHRLHLFVTTHPDNLGKAFSESKLHVTVSTVVASSSSTKVAESVISNVHGSDATVALGHEISLDTLPPDSLVQVELRLEGTSSMEIVAMFLCNAPPEY